jgi:hypothetical protein
MLYRLAADAVLLVHLAFILFVVFGALAAARRRWLVLVHLPAATWGFLVELAGLGCPLTSAENYLRMRAGQADFAGGFIEHYLLSLIYPAALTRHGQWALAAAVLVINGAIYAWLFRAHGRPRPAQAGPRNCPPA